MFLDRSVIRRERGKRCGVRWARKAILVASVVSLVVSRLHRVALEDLDAISIVVAAQDEAVIVIFAFNRSVDEGKAVGVANFLLNFLMSFIA